MRGDQTVPAGVPAIGRRGRPVQRCVLAFRCGLVAEHCRHSPLSQIDDSSGYFAFGSFRLAIALIGEPITLVGFAIARIGEPITFVGFAIARIGTGNVVGSRLRPASSEKRERTSVLSDCHDFGGLLSCRVLPMWPFWTLYKPGTHRMTVTSRCL
jgi:hypothetical protein